MDKFETIEASPTTAGIPMSKVIKAIEYLKPLFTWEVL